MQPENTTIVISCYKKAIPWTDRLRKMGFDIRAYTKEDPTSEYNVDKNIGMEATTYLKYIMDSYETMSEYVIFIHDDEFSWHHEGSIIDRITEKIGSNAPYHTLNNSHNLPYFYKDYNEEVSKFYDKFLKSYYGPLEQYGEFMGYTRIGAAQIIVASDTILGKPYEMYRDLYVWCMTNRSDDYQVSKETGIMFEYFWGIIFGDVKPLDFNTLPHVAIICSELVGNKVARYCGQMIDIYTVEPDNLSRYKWIACLDKPINTINLDHIYTLIIEYNGDATELYVDEIIFRTV